MSRHILSRTAFETALQRAGFPRLGSGVSSTVYGIPGDASRVLKVSIDAPWLEFMLWANADASRAMWAPKLYAVKWHRPAMGKAYFVAIIERVDVAQHSARRVDGAYYPEEQSADVEPFLNAARGAGFNTNDLSYHNWGFRCADGHVVIFDPTGYQFQNSSVAPTVAALRLKTPRTTPLRHTIDATIYNPQQSPI